MVIAVSDWFLHPAAFDWIWRASNHRPEIFADMMLELIRQYIKEFHLTLSDQIHSALVSINNFNFIG
jgi:hypothetical protein